MSDGAGILSMDVAREVCERCALRQHFRLKKDWSTVHGCSSVPKMLVHKPLKLGDGKK